MKPAALIVERFAAPCDSSTIITSLYKFLNPYFSLSYLTIYSQIQRFSYNKTTYKKKEVEE